MAGSQSVDECFADSDLVWCGDDEDRIGLLQRRAETHSEPINCLSYGTRRAGTLTTRLWRNKRAQYVCAAAAAAARRTNLECDACDDLVS